MQIDTEIKMTEINNFNNNFGIKKVQTKKINNEVMPEKQVTDVEERPLVQDTGVLGRSQVNFKGGDIPKSVDEAITAMKENPKIMDECDKLFYETYDNLTQNKGMDPTDA